MEDALPVLYMNSGLRRYGQSPVRIYERPAWELQLVLRGRASPTGERILEHHPAPVLYVFPPGRQHGWAAPVADTSEILVVHLLHPAVEGAGALPDQSCSFSLSELEILRFRTLYDWIHPEFVSPGRSRFPILEAGRSLLFSWIVELSSQWPPSVDTGVFSLAAWRVSEATNLYRRHILDNPTVEEIARMLGVSASQLRRDFANEGNDSPMGVFQSTRLDYARRLLVGSRESVGHVAETLGFGSTAVFSRAFLRYHGFNPGKARQQNRRLPEAQAP